MTSFAPFRDTGSTVLFENREAAGQQLAQAVLDAAAVDPIAANARFVVYALPRGGLPIAAPVAQALNSPLDVIVAKKITRPDNSELAIGAVTADGHVVWASHRRSNLPLSEQHTIALQHAQAHAQSQLRQLSPTGQRCDPQAAIALLVDDGIATGMTMAAAVAALRAQQPAQVWICAPVAPLEIMPFLKDLGDRVIILATPMPFQSVSRFYKEFNQVSTAEAASYLA